LFSVPIFFIVFRETLEAAIIVSVLLGIVEQIVHEDPARLSAITTQTQISTVFDDKDTSATPPVNDNSVNQDGGDQTMQMKRLVRKLRIQIFLGSALGLLISLAVGAAFLVVWFTEASNLWQKAELLWEGIFELIAALMIFVMGITMLKMDRAKAKWRIKLQRAFEGQNIDGRTRSGKWILFLLPMITVLREGLEAVIFVGGVSLGQPATSIPIATVVGLVCGLICGTLIYAFATRTTLTIFLVVMTNFILLIGAGLFTKSVNALQQHTFNVLLGADVDDSGGTGPGSYDVRGNVWHLDCCSPENVLASQGWTIFNALLGWTNNATVGSVLAYVFYWIAVVTVLVYMKFTEGRTEIMGRQSAAGIRRRENKAFREAAGAIIDNKAELPK